MEVEKKRRLEAEILLKQLPMGMLNTDLQLQIINHFKNNGETL